MVANGNRVAMQSVSAFIGMECTMMVGWAGLIPVPMAQGFDRTGLWNETGPDNVRPRFVQVGTAQRTTRRSDVRSVPVVSITEYMPGAS